MGGGGVGVIADSQIMCAYGSFDYAGGLGLRGYLVWILHKLHNPTIHTHLLPNPHGHTSLMYHILCQITYTSIICSVKRLSCKFIDVTPTVTHLYQRGL